MPAKYIRKIDEKKLADLKNITQIKPRLEENANGKLVAYLLDFWRRRSRIFA